MGEHKSKKRKKSHGGSSAPTAAAAASTEIDTSKPTAIFHPTAPRASTLSLALPSSILANAQTLDLKSQLASAISRAAAVFCVDEIVVFSDGAPVSAGGADSTDLLVHLLSYLETPQYLRRHLFDLHPHLRLAGILPPLDIPSHLRQGEGCLYREGVVLGESGEVEVGLPMKVRVRGSEYPPVGSRVTVKFASAEEGAGVAKGGKEIVADVVGPDVPRTESGYYWGYNVRIAPSLSAVFTEAPWEGGYDLTFGTSERGQDIGAVTAGELPRYKHMLVAFGGLAGLELAFKKDPELRGAVAEVRELFDYWVDACPGQGSRTIRTEEALWITMARLRGTVVSKGM
ncbi:putative RNA methyltransferase [Geopyxis carbonaria]|nr:putative RNA methyltransferase [Geopyxis carbonaria]